MRFVTCISHETHDVKSVEIEITAVLDKEYVSDPVELMLLETALEKHDNCFVVGTLTATRHNSRAMNLADIPNEYRKNCYLNIEQELADRLLCHAEDLPEEITVPGLIGESCGLLAIHEVSVPEAARGQKISWQLLSNLKELHAGLPYFVAASMTPYWPHLSANNYISQADDLATYFCICEYLNLQKIQTCDGSNLLVSWWDGDLDAPADELIVEVDEIIERIRRVPAK